MDPGAESDSTTSYDEPLPRAEISGQGGGASGGSGAGKLAEQYAFSDSSEDEGGDDDSDKQPAGNGGSAGAAPGVGGGGGGGGGGANGHGALAAQYEFSDSSEDEEEDSAPAAAPAARAPADAAAAAAAPAPSPAAALDPDERIKAIAQRYLSTGAIGLAPSSGPAPQSAPHVAAVARPRAPNVGFTGTKGRGKKGASPSPPPGAYGAIQQKHRELIAAVERKDMTAVHKLLTERADPMYKVGDMDALSTAASAGPLPDPAMARSLLRAAVDLRGFAATEASLASGHLKQTLLQGVARALSCQIYGGGRRFTNRELASSVLTSPGVLTDAQRAAAASLAPPPAEEIVVPQSTTAAAAAAAAAALGPAAGIATDAAAGAAAAAAAAANAAAAAATAAAARMTSVTMLDEGLRAACERGDVAAVRLALRAAEAAVRAALEPPQGPEGEEKAVRVAWTCERGDVATVRLALRAAEAAVCAALEAPQGPDGEEKAERSVGLALERLLGAADVEGHSALHWAVKCKHSQLVSELLSAGADAEQRDKVGRTPLHLAADINDKDMLLLLLHGYAARHGGVAATAERMIRADPVQLGGGSQAHMPARQHVATQQFLRRDLQRMCRLLDKTVYGQGKQLRNDELAKSLLDAGEEYAAMLRQAGDPLAPNPPRFITKPPVNGVFPALVLEPVPGNFPPAAQAPPAAAAGAVGVAPQPAAPAASAAEPSKGTAAAAAAAAPPSTPAATKVKLPASAVRAAAAASAAAKSTIGPPPVVLPPAPRAVVPSGGVGNGIGSDVDLELCRAVMDNDVPAVTRALQKGANPAGHAYGGRTPLHEAANRYMATVLINALVDSAGSAHDAALRLQGATFARVDLQRVTRLLGHSVYAHADPSSKSSGGRRLTNRELATNLCDRKHYPLEPLGAPPQPTPGTSGRTMSTAALLACGGSSGSSAQPGPPAPSLSLFGSPPPGVAFGGPAAAAAAVASQALKRSSEDQDSGGDTKRAKTPLSSEHASQSEGPM
ncbi:hypothetical protein JKP88DRAFT_350769 [Tribonema minus]|uniref:Uncharacterized protein n=1 Tax=Tribonema minus TaxID=303371 RepID=A0A835YM39_9STRA|nr:hypothetical protein JKP88DRAFT_350769 [Tribonema minus]